jgi:hypothetical protein
MRAFLRLYLPFLVIISGSLPAVGDPGDTTIVQTFTFEAQNNPNTASDSPGRRWFTFPASDNGIEYQKILMYHTLKCFEDGGAGGLAYPCGEWDYLTYNNLFSHTGEYDSTYSWHLHYLLNNQSFETVDLATSPVQDMQEVQFDYLVVDEVLSEVASVVGNGSLESYGPLSEELHSKVQYLITAGELLQSGLEAGEIDRLALTTGSASADHHFFSIRMKHTSSDFLDALDQTDFQEVFSMNLNLPDPGEHSFLFNSPFIWDGASNILIEFTYDNQVSQPTALISGDNSGFISSATSAGDDRYIQLDGNSFVHVPSTVFSDLTDEITISFWQYGSPEIQPTDGTCFEGLNAANQRVLNAHVPWINSRVYWDAGSDGSYDRIDKLAAVNDFEGKWNHWAFTKNSTTGEMKIYLNGVLWHSGTDKTKVMSGIEKFTIGSAVSGSNFYQGKLDEFAVWTSVLDEATIREWMWKDLDATHPDYSALRAYYTFNEENDEMVADHSGSGNDAWVIGGALRIPLRGREIFRNVQLAEWRPQISFYQGDYLSHSESQTALWPLPPAIVSVAEYAIVNYSPEVIDVEYYYQAGWHYTYDDSGLKIDSTLQEYDVSLSNDTLWYYQSPFEVVLKYELGRFITPYGIGLDLEEGWTWIYDVTDFGPLLRDEVELQAGNWQELLDLTFLFIEGTPARPVSRIENVWSGNHGLSVFNERVTPAIFSLEPQEESLKLRTTVTGHGFNNPTNCAEFCHKTHSVSVNGNSEWQWDIIQECGENPLYPQGGTWLNDRSGWCPGMEGKTNEFELTPYLGNGEVEAEYSIDSDPHGNYVIESQIVYYGPNNFEHDPEIETILAPSNFRLNSRWNPMCNRPRIVLRNLGSQPLTQLSIQYGPAGGTQNTFLWTGNLSFMEREEVELVYSDEMMWQGAPDQLMRFVVDLGESADGPDDNPFNNHAESTFMQPVSFSYLPEDPDDNRMIIIVKTNQSYSETSYSITDLNGNVVFSRSNFTAPFTFYRDTIQLNRGCYRFHLDDSAGDGLSYFANDDGVGYCKLDRVSGPYFYEFEKNFGEWVDLYFFFDTDLVSVHEMLSNRFNLSLYPNPSNGKVKLDIHEAARSIDVEVIDVRGASAYRRSFQRTSSSESLELDLTSLSDGLYLIRVNSGERFGTLRFLKH